MITRDGTPAQSEAAYRKMNILYCASFERDARNSGEFFLYLFTVFWQPLARADSFVIPFPFSLSRAVADRRLYSTSESWAFAVRPRSES